MRFVAWRPMPRLRSDFLILKLCSAFHDYTSLHAVNFKLCKGGRDSLKEFCRVSASVDDGDSLLLRGGPGADLLFLGLTL